MPDREKEPRRRRLTIEGVTYIGKTPLVDALIHQAVEEMSTKVWPALEGIKLTPEEIADATLRLEKAAQELKSERKQF